MRATSASCWQNIPAQPSSVAHCTSSPRSLASEDQWPRLRLGRPPLTTHRSPLTAAAVAAAAAAARRQLCSLPLQTNTQSNERASRVHPSFIQPTHPTEPPFSPLLHTPHSMPAPVLAHNRARASASARNRALWLLPPPPPPPLSESPSPPFASHGHFLCLSACPRHKRSSQAIFLSLLDVSLCPRSTPPSGLSRPPSPRPLAFAARSSPLLCPHTSSKLTQPNGTTPRHTTPHHTTRTAHHTSSPTAVAEPPSPPPAAAMDIFLTPPLLAGPFLRIMHAPERGSARSARDDAA